MGHPFVRFISLNRLNCVDELSDLNRRFAFGLAVEHTVEGIIGLKIYHRTLRTGSVLTGKGGFLTSKTLGISYFLLSGSKGSLCFLQLDHHLVLHGLASSLEPDFVAGLLSSLVGLEHIVQLVIRCGPIVIWISTIIVI